MNISTIKLIELLAPLLSACACCAVVKVIDQQQGRQTNMFTRNILLLIFLSFLVCFCSSIDTITFNQPLKDGDLLISNAKSFALGFFSPGNSPGNKRYVGIWYQTIPGKTVVWVANRDSPVNGTSGILSIDKTGNLVIQDRNTNIPVWKTNHSSPVTGTETYSAQLLDTGNMVLYLDPDRKGIKWQSFDYPTNTLLPSMKLGVDKKTGLNRILQSWKSSDDPAMGQYVLDLEITGSGQVFLKRSWGQVWRSGPWNGVGFNGVPEMSQDGVNLNYVETEDEVTISYSLRDPSVNSMFVVNESGTVNKLTWQGQDKGWVSLWSAPEDKCDGYAPCKAFGHCDQDKCLCLTGFQPVSGQEWNSGDNSRGCERDKTDVCNNGEGFMKMTGVKIPDTQITAVVNRTIKGLKECENLCLKNCSCNGYASANVSNGGLGCFFWYGDLTDMREVTNGGQDMFIRLSASDLAQLKKKSKGHILEITLVVLFAAVALLVCFFIIKMRKYKKRQQINTRDFNTSSEIYEGSSTGMYVDESGTTDVLIFDLKAIQSATDNFSADNKLGQGGFGSVYKGRLPNEQLVAVKRLSRSSGQGIEEFKNEVTLIARLQHRNLVRLLGCCVEQGEKMLVYEYMPNKALDSFIFDNTKGKSLDWTKRFEIILGIARGLLYLHRDSRLRIIHRDMKASNVLLDASMNPKISDFGMAKMFGGDQNEANTNRVVGTYGYMSPEYAMEGHFSVKSDVFSFGVLLLEIVSGRKNKNPYRQNSLNLIGDVWDFWNEGTALSVVDPSLGESYDARKVLRCIHVGLLCVQALANARPTMSEVVFMLCNETKLPRPNQPGFILSRHENSAAPSASITGGSQSVNSMTMTEIDGR